MGEKDAMAPGNAMQLMKYFLILLKALIKSNKFLNEKGLGKWYWITRRKKRWVKDLNLTVVDKETATNMFSIKLYFLTPTNGSSFVNANLTGTDQFSSIKSRKLQSRISSSLNLHKS